MAEEELTIPLYPDKEPTLRLKQSVIDIEEADLSVTCGAGLGGDFIELRDGRDTAVVYMRDLLKIWMEGRDPEKAKRIPSSKALTEAK